MASKVFISWGGNLSKRLAEEIKKWLPSVLQFVKPYFTPDDIEKGARWESNIAQELSSSNIGIICLTKDNINRPWILFEAGALSKNLDKSNVCTILFNVDSSEITGPLTCFQATKFDETDFKKLIKTINNTSPPRNIPWRRLLLFIIFINFCKIASSYNTGRQCDNCYSKNGRNHCNYSSNR